MAKKEILPRVKKKISSYIMAEHGKISKQSMLMIGALIGSGAIGTISSSKLVNAQLSGTLEGEGSTVTITGSHSSHSSHSSHRSHGAHSNHGAHASHGAHGSHSNTIPECGSCESGPQTCCDLSCESSAQCTTCPNDCYNSLECVSIRCGTSES